MIYLLLSLIFYPRNTFRYFYLRRRMRILEGQWDAVMRNDALRDEWLATCSALERIRPKVSAGLLLWAESKDDPR